MLVRVTLAGLPRCWLGLVWLGLAHLDLSVDPKFYILSICKSIWIHITSKNNINITKIIYTAIHEFTFGENPSR
jgi:hypothetical protein